MMPKQPSDREPDPWLEHNIPVTRTFAKVSIASRPDEITRSPAGYTTIGLSPQGWQDPEFTRLLALGGHVARAWVVRWANGYPVREPNDMRVCRHCWRPIFHDPRGPGEAEEWNLVYREYFPPRWCDARSDGVNLDTIGHEPWTAEDSQERNERSEKP